MKICVHNDGLGRCSVSGEHCTDGPCDCEDLVEFEPVRHGVWVSRFAKHWKGKDECGKCGFHEKDHRDLSHYKYCPNCGVKMDGDSHAD